MKIGVLSDTHNHLPETRRALAALMARGARHLVHCGDAGDDVVDLLAATGLAHGIRTHLAIGNCDPGRDADARFAPLPAGIERGSVLEFTLAGKRCAVLHGNHPGALQNAIASGTFDYVFTGHTHQPQDEQAGRTRILNPGSCARPRGGPPTVLLLDLATGEARWIPAG